MASDKQIAANRANSKKSTGPKTAAGKQKSSRNAYRHGLSRPEPPDSSSVAKANAIAGALLDAPAIGDRLKAAQDFALAQLELLRIQAIGAEQWGEIDLRDGLDANTKAEKRLASLDRYDRYTLTKLRKASKELRSEGVKREDTFFAKTSPICQPVCRPIGHRTGGAAIGLRALRRGR